MRESSHDRNSDSDAGSAHKTTELPIIHRKLPLINSLFIKKMSRPAAMKAIQSGTKCKQDESKTLRAVSFSETYEAYKVLTLNDYTGKEIARTWYNDDELRVIAHKCHKIIRRMKNGIDNGKYCMRGLERMVGDRNDTLNRNRCNAYDAVLIEQEDQFEDGREDQELIAQLYHAVSGQCQTEAAKLGLSDEHAVDRYLSRERRVPVEDYYLLPKLKKDLLPPSAPTPMPTNRRSCAATTA
jgi:hypothetical protein